MKILSSVLCASVAFALCGCESDGTGQLIGDYDPSSLAAGEDNTQHHFQDPGSGDNGVTDPHEVKVEMEQVGSPEVVSRVHACSKITYASLGSILQTRGINIGSTNQNSAGALYKGGASALGVPNYSGRVPEALIASTAALSKQFDIFVSAAREIQPAPNDTDPKAMNLTLMGSACPSVQLISSGQFTKDGLSCLMGKPATPEHVQVANDAIATAKSKGMTAVQGQQLAIATLLEAAHTCE